MGVKKVMRHFADKRTIGYTSGVFDLFHVGHLRLLQRARALCDYLIVGVTIDELVAYKNTQVLIPFAERLEIVSQIKGVDLAIPQDNLDKTVMWRKLKFDVMFIGDDWFETERLNGFERDLGNVGVKVIYLPYSHVVSTTILKARLQCCEKSRQGIVGDEKE